MELHGDDLVDCPYCMPPKNHQLKYKTLATHLCKVRKSDPELRKRKTCKFNALHLLRMEEMEHHHATCPDRRNNVMYPDFEASTSYEKPNFDYSPPRQRNAKIFRLNPNNLGPAGLYHSRAIVRETLEQRRLPFRMPEPKRVPVGAPEPREASAGMPVVASQPPLNTRFGIRRATKCCVTETQAFNKPYLLSNASS